MRVPARALRNFVSDPHPPHATYTIRQHTSASGTRIEELRLRPAPTARHLHRTSAYVSIRQHTSAYVDICRHTSAYVGIRQHSSAYGSIRQHTSAYVSIRQHTSAYVAQHTSVYVSMRQQTTSTLRPHTRGPLVAQGLLH
jgi:hypothetical protein